MAKDENVAPKTRRGFANGERCLKCGTTLDLFVPGCCRTCYTKISSEGSEDLKAQRKEEQKRFAFSR